MRPEDADPHVAYKLQDATPPARPDLRELRFIIPLRSATNVGMVAEDAPDPIRTLEVHVFRQGSETWRYYTGTTEGGAIVFREGQVAVVLRPRDVLRILAAWMGELP